MKLAVPVDGSSMQTSVCQSFGRAPYFLIYDTETEEARFFKNDAAAAQGGAGIRAAQWIVDQDVQALLTPRCGNNAALVLQAANIKIYKTQGDSLEENIRAFATEELPVLKDIHPGFHRRRGRF